MPKTTRRTLFNIMKNIYWLLLPPFISDNKMVWKFINKVFRINGDIFFRLNIHRMTIDEYEHAYSILLGRDNTDMGHEQIQAVSEAVKGTTVCELGCGSGILSNHLASLGHKVVACDINPPSSIDKEKVEFKSIDLMRPPTTFIEEMFDTVVSCFVLEHLVNSREVVREMYRIARQRLIILVPCEKYTRFIPNYHIHFYPDEAQLCMGLGIPPSAEIRKVEGDWLVIWGKEIPPPGSTFMLYGKVSKENDQRRDC